MPSPPTVVSTQARAIVKIRRLQETRPDYLRFSAIVQPTADGRTGNPLFCRGFTRTDADGKQKNREPHGSAGVTPRRRAGGLKPCPEIFPFTINHSIFIRVHPRVSAAGKACLKKWLNSVGNQEALSANREPRLDVRPDRKSTRLN